MRRETRVSQDSRAKRDSLHEIYNRESITEPSLGGSETRLPRTENLNEIIAPALRQPRVNNSTQPAAERGWKARLRSNGHVWISRRLLLPWIPS